MRHTCAGAMAHSRQALDDGCHPGQSPQVRSYERKYVISRAQVLDFADWEGQL